MHDVSLGNNRFAFDLHSELQGRPGNLIFSPYSISTALAMTSLGARGQTAEEMIRTLHLPADPKDLEVGFAELHAQLGGKGEDRPYRLATANALWVQSGLDYRSEFLLRCRAGFDARLEPIDFAGDPEAARRTINAWVAKQTLDKIRDLLAPTDVSKETDLILTNAIYFKAAWATPFPKRDTRDELFHAGRTSDPVPMMHLTGLFNYVETDQIQALELPYVHDDLSAIVVLPKKVDGLPAIEDTLSVPTLEAWLTKRALVRVEVSLPRFKLESSIELAGMLAGMGMPSAFGLDADFSGIAAHREADRKFMLSAVIHKTFAEVNEEGTEAAAATAVIRYGGGMAMAPQKPPVVFHADHPFLFLVRERRSRSILFLGRVANPKG